jgi:hypothetical protein
LSEIVDGEGRVFEDATIFAVETIFEALLNISQRFACFTDETVFLEKAKCQVFRSAG